MGTDGDGGYHRRPAVYACPACNEGHLFMAWCRNGQPAQRVAFPAHNGEQWFALQPLTGGDAIEIPLYR
jgi:hypothetical protein